MTIQLEPTDREYFQAKALRIAAEDAAHFAARREMGQVYHRISVEAYAIVMRAALLEIDMGIRPNVAGLLRQFAVDTGQLEGWAEAVAGQISIKRMTAALEVLYSERVFTQIEERGMLTPTFKRDLSGSSITGVVHRTYEQSMIVKKIASHETRIKELEAVVARTQVRIEMHDEQLREHGIQLKQTGLLLEVREQYALGRSIRSIAAQFGVSKSEVGRMVKRSQ